MPEISSVKSLKHKCVNFIVNNIDSFPKESLSIELEPVHPKKVPFYFKDLRILPNKFSYKISLFISLKFFFVIASSLSVYTPGGCDIVAASRRTKSAAEQQFEVMLPLVHLFKVISAFVHARGCVAVRQPRVALAYVCVQHVALYT